MCGILGGWWHQAPGNLTQRLQAGVDALRHRGPNDSGIETSEQSGGTLGLAHTRLSILDLSPAGHQPRRSADGRYWMTFNGEIYNYRELRVALAREGHVFDSDSDTEVLLCAWQSWGEAALPRLTGMFAFVVFDTVAQTLTCVVDPFAIKPFFWRAENGSFSFASEARALQALAGGPPRLNWQTAYDYLAHGVYDSSASTFTQGVHRLPAGQLLRWKLGANTLPTVHVWWQAPVVAPRRIGFADATAQLREMFLDSVRLHLRSDVPLGAALSGGIDSSAIVCAMRHLEPELPLHTVSFIAEGSPQSEAHWVDQINQHVGAIPHKVVVQPGELVTQLDDLIQAQGEPFGSTSIYAQYRVFKAARENGLTVMLEGQGADEVLAGYQGYPAFRMQSLIETGRLPQAVSFMMAWRRWPGRDTRHLLRHTASLFLKDDTYHTLRTRFGHTESEPAWLDARLLDENQVRRSYPRPTAMAPAPGRRVIQELARALGQSGLPALLRQGDRNAMRFSIENRVPFLTLELAEFLLSLPEDYLISRGGETKHILRAALRGLVPDAILDRRDKIGLVTPEHQWLKDFAPQAREWLADSQDIPFLNTRALLDAFDAIIQGKQPFSWQAWRWINFVRWYRVSGMQA
ncbi:Asparagine synthetase [glutamine-hydrolyzing] [plant metagenome]|uniref:Asparagine synthetase [glutamine-hydrolyzing] n=1 Tax=plant metagenome TaxID=1297885 RepID=A0A484NVD1_9ZZZZ